MQDTIDFKTVKYESKHNQVKWEWVRNFEVGKLQTLKKNFFAYKIRDLNGKPIVGCGRFNYLDAKYKEPQKIKRFDFEKYSNSNSVDDDDTSKRFDLKHINFKDERNEINPVQTDTSDSSYLFDSEDAIIVNLKNKNNNNNNNN